jgi:tetratricopeptide (TPR) repeat protein
MNKEELKQAIEAAQAAKDYQTAEGIAKDAIGSFPEDSFGYLHLAETLLLANDEQLDPSNIKHLVSFASAKSRNGEYAVAQFFWDKILQIDPQNITAFAAKGWYELNIAEDYSKAVPLFNGVI